MHLTFADLITQRILITAPEAVALTLAVARVLDAERAAGRTPALPVDDWLILNSQGDVSIVDVHGSSFEEETAALAALLRRLLQLDTPFVGERRERVPGALLLVIARSSGAIDLPAADGHEFRVALERFAPPDAAILAALFWRAARARTDARRANGRLPLRKGSDERRGGPSPTELRRTIRELERQLFMERAAADAALADRPPAPVASSWGYAGSPLAQLSVGLLVLASLIATAVLTGGASKSPLRSSDTAARVVNLEADATPGTATGLTLRPATKEEADESAALPADVALPATAPTAVQQTAESSVRRVDSTPGRKVVRTRRVAPTPAPRKPARRGPVAFEKSMAWPSTH